MLRIDASRRSSHPVNPFLFGKFCEHLGSNIYNGMEAQILRNPTFGKWAFGCGGDHINGGAKFEHDFERIAENVKRRAERTALPDPAPVLEAYEDGCAFHWQRIGPREEVVFSPDAGPYGARAQRIEVKKASAKHAAGIGQWTHLPLHRVRTFEFRIVGRSAGPVQLTLGIAPMDKDGHPVAAAASANVALSREWTTQKGALDITGNANIEPGGLFFFSVSVDEPANVVLDRVLLYPADHVNFADPDVIRFLKEMPLPLLRWPGGNFVSGYHWRDGVGPVDARPTLPNPAWGGLEYNFFGTDEFIAFCREVGCEPMICVNAGNGSAKEAAAWVEYCNGSADTPMGRLRAGNGHPEPFSVRYWEIGNEISGRHQIGWTTANGNVDRFLRFAEAMQAVDASIELMGCGAPWGPEHEWNQRLIHGTEGKMRIITDHILAGGGVEPDTTPEALFNAFMVYPVFLGKQYRAMRKEMEKAGIKRPRLAITELQLFARIKQDAGKTGPLTHDRMPTPATISEALYNALITHECIRMGDFVEMVTHSATVNHGGGLRKTKERVWANPCYYGRKMMSALAGGTPVALRLQCEAFSTDGKAGSLPAVEDVSAIDTMAVLRDDGVLHMMLVHRLAGAGPVKVAIDLGEFKAVSDVQVVTLSGATAHDANTPEEPERIVPQVSSARVEDGVCTVTLPSFSLMRVEFRGK